MQYYRIDVYVPGTHADAVKSAMFAAGAGRLGNYDSCCFQICGTGQFRPLDGANPYLGTAGQVEQVTEWKLEMVCPEERLRAVITALRGAHPYETPSYQYWAVSLE